MASITVVETRPTGTIADGSAYFESSTNKFVVYDATNASWLAFASDGTGSIVFNTDIVDTEANIHALTPTNPTGEYTIAFGSDTHDLYVWTGTLWMKYSND